MNAYLWIRAPYDGRTVGICGNFGGNRGRDYSVMFNSNGRRHSSQWSTSYRDKVAVKAEDSFFKCGDTYDIGYRYSPYKFKSMRANQMVSVAQKMIHKQHKRDERTPKQNICLVRQKLTFHTPIVQYTRGNRTFVSAVGDNEFVLGRFNRVLLT